MSDIIDYRPIRTMLEDARKERVNGFSSINKEDQAIIDHIDSVLEGYERILEDLENIADVTSDLDELSTQGIDILLKIGLVDEVDASDMVKPIPLADLEDDSESSDDESEDEDE